MKHKKVAIAEAYCRILLVLMQTQSNWPIANEMSEKKKNKESVTLTLFLLKMLWQPCVVPPPNLSYSSLSLRAKIIIILFWQSSQIALSSSESSQSPHKTINQSSSVHVCCQEKVCLPDTLFSSAYIDQYHPNALLLMATYLSFTLCPIIEQIWFRVLDLSISGWVQTRFAFIENICHLKSGSILHISAQYKLGGEIIPQKIYWICPQAKFYFHLHTYEGKSIESVSQ